MNLFGFIFLLAATTTEFGGQTKPIKRIDCVLLNWKDLDCTLITTDKQQNMTKCNLYHLESTTTNMNKTNIKNNPLITTISIINDKHLYFFSKPEFMVKKHNFDFINVKGVCIDLNKKNHTQTFKIPISNIIYMKDRIKIGKHSKMIKAKIEISPW